MLLRVETAVSLDALLSDDGRRDPYAFYAELHRLGPVSKPDSLAHRYDVVVHGYAAVDRVLRDPTFGVVDAQYMDTRRSPWREHHALRTLFGSIFFTNGPQHTRVRRLFSQVFTPRRVMALHPAITRLIDEGLDHLARSAGGGAPVDFIGEFALPLPSDVIGELLGVPEADRAWFPPRVRAVGRILELGTGTWTHLSAANEAAVELSGYFAELAAKRRAEPRDDLLSALVQLQAGGGELSDAELVANLVSLFNAGFVTTTHLFGNGLALLLDRPELAEALRADPTIADGYVEEILRFEPPVHYGVRVAASDTEIEGIPVPAGGRALVLMAAANRDPARFPDPDRFDPFRRHGSPLSFGGGAHYCLGAALSRLEGQLALPMLLRRFPDLALAGPPGPRSSLVLRGFDTLPVALR